MLQYKIAIFQSHQIYRIFLLLYISLVSHNSIELSFFPFLSFQNNIIDQQSYPADRRRDNDEHNGQGIILGAHRVAAEGGEDDRGEARRRGQGHVEGDAHVGQTDGVGQ